MNIRNNKSTKKKSKKKQSLNKFLFWIPRIISILFLLFLAMFSLDIFDGNYGLWGTILGLFMHNIPVFVLLIFLIIAWKHEIVGSIIFFIGGLLYILSIIINSIKTPPFHFYYLSWSLIIAGPAFVISWL